MCIDCWKNKYGSSNVDNRLVQELLASIDRVYSYNAVGGSLHVVLDDWNLETRHVVSAKRFSDESFAKGEISIHQHWAELDCVRLLKKASIGERASALARYDFYIVNEQIEAE